jgi:hypothetical protein
MVPVHECFLDQVNDVIVIPGAEHWSWSKPWLLTDTGKVVDAIMRALVDGLDCTAEDAIMSAVVDGLDCTAEDAIMSAVVDGLDCTAEDAIMSAVVDGLDCTAEDARMCAVVDGIDCTAEDDSCAKKNVRRNVGKTHPLSLNIRYLYFLNSHCYV